ncbi:MAG: TIGR01212 family radical SAM protein [Muribaculaceae bacterium]|nr:TIGR01212 family radical SAM protein [Muribaculaceae bacterium]
MKTYGDYLSGIFEGHKVQKISVDAGFTCPNRDGTISTGGCIYCRNDSFSPGYCDSGLSVKDQLEKGKNFFSHKYPEMKYLAYFQSYTGTYNKSIQELSKLYQEALEVEDILGLVIATRPDCISDDVLELLSTLNGVKPIFIELGAETSHDNTLKLVNRNHTWEEVENSVKKIAARGLHCGIHLIAGLPGENREMILQTIKRTVNLPVETIKLHQLQVLKDTLLLQKLESGELEIPDFTLEEYLELCAEIVKMTPENIVIERFLSQSPPGMVITPSWGLKNYEFMSKLEKLL